MDGPQPTPTRITIDFTGSVQPGRAWILGRVDETGGRVELLAFDRAADDGSIGGSIGGESVADASGCTCPEFCERDHANE